MNSPDVNFGAPILVRRNQTQRISSGEKHCSRSASTGIGLFYWKDQKNRARLASPQSRPTSPVNGAGG